MNCQSPVTQHHWLKQQPSLNLLHRRLKFRMKTDSVGREGGLSKVCALCLSSLLAAEVTSPESKACTILVNSLSTECLRG